MQITDLLAQTGGLHSIAKELGISDAQAASGAAALAPAILGGLKKQAHAQPAGLEGLGGLLNQLGGGGLLDNVIRTYVLQSNVKLHPLLAFVSILGGLQVMGLWGLFIGPIVAALLIAVANSWPVIAEKIGVARGPQLVPPT